MITTFSSALAIVVIVVAGAAAEPRPSIVSICELLRRDARYALRITDTTIVILDTNDATELATITWVSAEQITIEAIVARCAHPSVEIRDHLRVRNEKYNGSAIVGTLDHAPVSGVVTITHHLDPRRSTAATVARVALLVVDAARAERRVIGEIVRGMTGSTRHSVPATADPGRTGARRTSQGHGAPGRGAAPVEPALVRF